MLISAEQWIAQTLEIKDRQDQKTKEIRPIDFKKECDLAYLRVKYKRYMKKKYGDYCEGYCVYREGVILTHSCAYNIRSAFANFNLAVKNTMKDGRYKAHTLVDSLGNTIYEVKGEY